MTYVEKQVLLQSLDHLWREHLVTLDHLRQVIGWRGYAQRDPLNEYKSEAFELFGGARRPSARAGDRAAHARRDRVPAARAGRSCRRCSAQHLDPATGENEFGCPQGAAFGAAPAPASTASARPSLAEARDPNDPASWGRVGRNEPCPCGSGKKFKHCHGSLVA